MVLVQGSCCLLFLVGTDGLRVGHGGRSAVRLEAGKGAAAGEGDIRYVGAHLPPRRRHRQLSDA